MAQVWGKFSKCFCSIDIAEQRLQFRIKIHPCKQLGPIFFTGTISDLCFYRKGSNYYVRTKSSLTTKRVLKDPPFKKTRENAGVLGKVSAIASKFYRSLDREKRNRKLYQKLTGGVLYQLKTGKNEKEIISILVKCLRGFFWKLLVLSLGSQNCLN